MCSQTQADIAGMFYIGLNGQLLSVQTAKNWADSLILKSDFADEWQTRLSLSHDVQEACEILRQVATGADNNVVRDLLVAYVRIKYVSGEWNKHEVFNMLLKILKTTPRSEHFYMEMGPLLASDEAVRVGDEKDYYTNTYFGDDVVLNDFLDRRAHLTAGIPPEFDISQETVSNLKK